MKPFWIIALLLPAAAGFATEPADVRPPPPKEPPRSQFVFSLLPKAFQRHPALDYHVITEMTAEGRKLDPPSPRHPVYYLAQPGKFTQLGHNAPGNEHAPDASELTRAMERALAASNYLAASPSSPLPAIVVVFNYGSFARFSTEDYDFQQSIALQQLYQNVDPSTPAPIIDMASGDSRGADALLPMVLSSPQDRLDVLQRAELVGGQNFARELAAALDKEAVYQQSSAGQLIPGMDNMSPFHQFMNQNANVMALVDESFSSCYFVVASAYDYVGMRNGRKVLLWRTKMTVNSSGVSMTESLPSLVINAGPYLGRDMTESVTLTRNISRQGNVEVGTPRVIDYSEGTVPSRPEKK